MGQLPASRASLPHTNVSRVAKASVPPSRAIGGTNLVGADAELQRFFNASSRERSRIATHLATDGITWKFNPPSVPHFGGKWEAGVKSVKFHLRRVIGETLRTYEEMTTLLAQIEAILNSRPLTAVSDDPSDVSALTPGYFLVGSALTAVPEPSLQDLPENRLTRWQLLHQMTKSFWQRWATESDERVKRTVTIFII
ncbi:PREDICTED: uncharacterized protein LOC108759452 [Trachymyrmex cornetzi]|uniref:uncharacterized protein LOC108759452 n=1 Tax=Trachymyrmex cornetzi TaxID=471704 RepID=UPI00084F3614|nr:PREDICTED: uncharacterized protein LOC108759452 [Trachymyrmex cornetzi]